MTSHLASESKEAGPCMQSWLAMSALRSTIEWSSMSAVKHPTRTFLPQAM